MSEDTLAKRFGDIAIQKKFNTKNKLLEAMTVQIENQLEEAEHKLIGAILIELGYMTEDQVNEVVETMSEEPRPKVGAFSKEKANSSWGLWPQTPSGHSSPRKARGILAFSRKPKEELKCPH
jgi:hypothetical protein